MRSSGRNGVVLTDVARVAGVSTATVSLALQKNPRISLPTREKVVRAVEQTGYRYNRVAAKLRTGQSKTIGLMITDITNPYFASMAAGVETELDRYGYMTFLVNSGDDHARQLRQLESLREHGVDGILLSPADGTGVSTVSDLLQNGIPVVQVSRWIAHEKCDVVAPDNVDIAAQATRHLLALGHRKIAFLGGMENLSARVERINGYRHALAEAGITPEPELMPTAAPTRANGASLLRTMISRSDPPTAALCYHDLMAFGAMEAARDTGLEVGRDFAIIGFDNVAEAALSGPPLTTAHIDAEEIGRTAASRLLARISGDDGSPERIIIPAHLVIRRSCGAGVERS